jgi:DNA/RNA endonuclease YhcR with UshA esterase domain
LNFAGFRYGYIRVKPGENEAIFVEERQILALSFAVSSAGLLLLYYVSINSTPPVVKISELTYDDVGTRVSIRGKLVSKKIHRDGHVFLKIKDETGEIPVVLFRSFVKKMDDICLEEGNFLEITGELQEYRNTLEILPKKKEDLRC